MVTVGPRKARCQRNGRRSRRIQRSTRPGSTRTLSRTGAQIDGAFSTPKAVQRDRLPLSHSALPLVLADARHHALVSAVLVIQYLHVSLSPYVGPCSCS